METRSTDKADRSPRGPDAQTGRDAALKRFVPRRVRRRVFGAAAALAALLAAGGSVGAVLAAGTSSTGAAKIASKGNVAVLYAGSLEDFVEKGFGPAFAKSTGYGFEGFGGGSNELAAQVKGGVREGDVFISASSSADNELKDSKNGSWVSWYSTFATSSLELGYNPHTKLGKELKKGVPWYKVLTQKGVRVGRTDPKLDPKGKLTVEAVDSAAKKLHYSALKKALGSYAVYPETTLVGRLQAGQLDAGFFYAIEADTGKFPTVAITPAKKYAEYTMTILNHAPNATGASAVLRSLLSAKETKALSKTGLKRIKPRFHGNASAVPKSLRKLVGAH